MLRMAIDTIQSISQSTNQSINEAICAGLELKWPKFRTAFDNDIKFYKELCYNLAAPFLLIRPVLDHYVTITFSIFNFERWIKRRQLWMAKYILGKSKFGKEVKIVSSGQNAGNIFAFSPIHNLLILYGPAGFGLFQLTIFHPRPHWETWQIINQWWLKWVWE